MNYDTRIHILISGVVQGVFFRAHTRNQARRLGLRGWVKNLPDGRVEVIAEGEKQAIEKFIEWCHQGPAQALVRRVEIEWQEPTGEFEDFKIFY